MPQHEAESSCCSNHWKISERHAACKGPCVAFLLVILGESMDAAKSDAEERSARVQGRAHATLRCLFAHPLRIPSLRDACP